MSADDWRQSPSWSRERLRQVDPGRGGRPAILEVGDWGYRQSSWDGLVLVQNWRSYLAEPERYLRHILT